MGPTAVAGAKTEQVDLATLHRNSQPGPSASNGLRFADPTGKQRSGWGKDQQMLHFEHCLARLLFRFFFLFVHGFQPPGIGVGKENGMGW